MGLAPKKFVDLVPVGTSAIGPRRKPWVHEIPIPRKRPGRAIAMFLHLASQGQSCRFIANRGGFLLCECSREEEWGLIATESGFQFPLQLSCDHANS